MVMSLNICPFGFTWPQASKSAGPLLDVTDHLFLTTAFEVISIGS